MSAAYNSMRDVYARVKEAYNDLGEADQKTIRLRYAALFGCLIAALMCMPIPAYGFSLLLPCIWCAIAIVLGLGKSTVNPITSIILDILSVGYIGYHGFWILIYAGMAESWWFLFADVLLFVSM
ncbi:hypothetical protein N7494_010618 [Penicillium frequentans]|uniref:Uncharacterized protein n=1 Tax=Penicillium frequentans TaxID=3151616 RepID=A0AAD6G8X3_9EURO|nr:hypothetical protein N7494_010618 [Penicillium glabrum]